MACTDVFGKGESVIFKYQKGPFFLVLTEKRKFEKGRKPTEKIIGFFRVGK